ncbi:hypothetical protein TrVGV298_007851 [Trichoderma virens]|nr:hypothetical protein TrVGV298_007851 [Trichoderma virens]
MWNPRQTAGSVDDPAWGAVKLLLIVIKLRYNDYFRYTIEDHVSQITQSRVVLGEKHEPRRSNAAERF